MSRLFGTDGIRARFGDTPLDRPTVTKVGWALARELVEQASEPSSAKPNVVVGGDTRASTPTLARWLAEGLEAGGAHIVWVGVIPTPGVAWLAKTLDHVAAGVAVSASHNPAEDNGIKLLTGQGGKWALADEQRLEQRILSQDRAFPPSDLSPTRQPELLKHYVASLSESVAPDGTRDNVPDQSSSEGQEEATRPFSGLTVALDTSHGAASQIAGGLFESLGATVHMMSNEPDGNNINHECGSTHPEHLARRVIETSSDLGIAFDGDADRAILVDEQGEVRDGDAILYLWSLDLLARGELETPKIVATTMSNLGLEVALKERGIELVRCGVGDRTLVETLEEHSLDLGGEQSGHIVRRSLSTTGDGLLTALQLTRVVARSGKPLSHLLRGFKRFPQVLVNARVSSKPLFAELHTVTQEASSIEQELGDKGRLLLRYSGTEPLARVMIEGEDQSRIEHLAHSLAKTIQREIG